MIEQVRQQFLRFRLVCILLLNAGLAALSYVAALCLRFDFDRHEYFTVQRLFFPLSILLLFRAIAYMHFKLNQGYWRYVSTDDLLTLIKAHAASSFVFLATVMSLRIPEYPRSVIFIEFALSILLCGGSRFFVRLFCERYLGEVERRGGLRKPVIILGAGDSGHLLVKHLKSQGRIGYEPLVVLDDSERLIGSTVHGVRVAGPLSQLEKKLEKYPRVAAVICAIPTLSQTRLKQLQLICDGVNVPLKKLQSFEDIALSETVEIEGPSIEKVLEREVLVEHEDEIRKALAGKRVLVTGAGGSIGSELVRQLLPFKPAAITLFDNNEYNMFNVQREFRQNWSGIKKTFVLGTIKDQERLMRVFEEVKPEIVFHAAAYKHVPLMEENCYEAFVNNVVGTRNVLQASVNHGVSRFVLISTDKAVDPSSIMGCSKRLAELLVAEYGRGKDNGSWHPAALSTAVVRFGNVINSAGSVIPIFKEQILSGGPVTVTHPDMERFFMSIREAVRLVLTAGILGKEGEVYLLNMGKPIKIVDVAKKMLALYGRRDIPIVYTGVRPGEKLTEELTSSFEMTAPTRFRKVRKIEDIAVATNEQIATWVAGTEERLSVLTDAEIGQLLHSYVRTVKLVKEEQVRGGVRVEVVKKDEKQIAIEGSPETRRVPFNY